MNPTGIKQHIFSKINLATCIVLSVFSMLLLPSVSLSQQAAASGYETPGILKASEILPPELLEGDHFKVMEEVATYDFTNRFTISTAFGQFEVIGEDMLRIRIQEILAIAALQEIKKTKAFRDAAEQAAMSPLRGARDLVNHPVDTVNGIPKGVGRFFEPENERFTGNVEYRVTEEMAGFFKLKQQHAHILGVNIYSTNKKLQRELNGVTWTKFASGMSIKLNMETFRGIYNAAFFTANGDEFTQNMNQLILDNAPENLGRLNREKLELMGIREDVMETFLNHSIFSPRHQTFIVHALAEINQAKNRGYFIEQANYSIDKEDSFFYQRIAEMMLNFHKNVEPIVEIIPVRRVVVGYTDKKSIIATLPIDYVHWTEQADHGTDALLQLNTPDRPVKSLKISISGKLSSRARIELKAKGIEMEENM